MSTNLRRLSVACGLALVAVAWSSNASAEDAVASRAPKTWASRRELVLSFRQGLFIDGQAGGIALGADALHRRGLLVLGVASDYGTAALSPYAYWGGGPTLGISAPSPSWLRLDLLGVAGAHAYSNVGGPRIFGAAAASAGYLTDQGSSAVLPFAGARLRCSFELGGSGRFAIGLEALAETDLARVTRSYQTTSSGFGFREESTQRRTVGTERLAGALTLGGAFDL